MKAYLGFLLAALLVVSVLPGMAMGQMTPKQAKPAAMAGSMMGSGKMMGGMMGSGVSAAAMQYVEQIHASRDAIKARHTEMKTDLKDLARRHRDGDYGEESEDEFYREYRHTLLEYVTMLKHMAEYVREVSPEHKIRVEAILAKIDNAIDRLESLPERPTKDQFREIHAVLKDVKQLIKELREKFHDSEKNHRRAAHEDFKVRLHEIVGKIRSHGDVPGVEECAARLRAFDEEDVSEEEARNILKDIVHCLKQVHQPTEA